MQPTESTQSTPQISEIPSAPPVSSTLPELNQAEEAEKLARISWYTSPEFTRKLLEHMHRAKIAALAEFEHGREQ